MVKLENEVHKIHVRETKVIDDDEEEEGENGNPKPSSQLFSILLHSIESCLKLFKII